MGHKFNIYNEKSDFFHFNVNVKGLYEIMAALFPKQHHPCPVAISGIAAWPYPFE